MPDVLQTYKFAFEFDQKNIKKQLKAVSLDVKDLVSQMGDASDKVTVFKDLVTYISNVDKALTMFKNNHQDTFANLFGNPDADITSVLTKIFDTTTQAAQGFGDLKEKIDAAANGKVSTKQLKALAEEMNNLFMSVGKEAPFPNLDEAFDHKRYTTKINMMKNALSEFATVFADMQDKLMRGFNFGEGSGGQGAVTEIQAIIDHVKAKNKELSEAKAATNKILNEFKNVDKNGISDAYKVVVTEDSVKGLISEYDKLKTNLDAADASSAEYYNTLTKLLGVSLKLKSALRDVYANNDLKNQFMNTKTSTNHHDLFEALSVYGLRKNPIDNMVDKVLKENQIGSIISNNEALVRELRSAEDINDAINKRIQLYDTLIEKFNQYVDLQDNITYEDDKEEDSEEIKQQKAMLRDSTKEIAKLTGATNQMNEVNRVLQECYDEAIDAEEAVAKLFKTFGLDTPTQLSNKLKTLLSESGFVPGVTGGVAGQSGFASTASGANQAGEQVDTLGKKVLDTTEYVSTLSSKLKEMFDATGRRADFEYHIAIDGLDVKARHGLEKSVDIQTQASTYLDKLFANSAIYGHSHRGGDATTNISDIEGLLTQYKNGVSIPVHFVVGNDAITTIDFSGVSKDIVDKLIQEIAATNTKNKTAPVDYDVINNIVENLTGKSGALQTWSVDKFDDLAKYFYDISNAATSTLTPLEKFQAVLDYVFEKGKVDASKYESLLSVLNQDNAKSIFNQIAAAEKLPTIDKTDMLTMGQVNAEIDASIAKYKTLREEACLMKIFVAKSIKLFNIIRMVARLIQVLISLSNISQRENGKRFAAF